MALKTPKCQDCISCDLKSPLFHLLNKSELQKLNADRFEVNLKEGDYIFKQGTAASHILSLAKGRVKLFFEGNNQRQFAFKIACQWELLGGPGLFVDKRYHYSASSLEDSMVCYINLESFKALLCENKEFGEAFWKQQNLETIQFYNRFLSTRQKQMHGKLADVLIYLSTEVFPETSSGFKIDRNILAELTGMTRDTVVRVLNRFSNDGVIQMIDNSIKILDPIKLKEFSHFG